jgi:hypothetical protein
MRFKVMPMVFPLLIAGAVAIGLGGAAVGLGVGAAAGYYYYSRRWYPYPYPVVVYPQYYTPPPMYPGHAYYPGYW